MLPRWPSYPEEELDGRGADTVGASTWDVLREHPERSVGHVAVAVILR